MTDREADEAIKQVRGNWRPWLLLFVTLGIAGWGGFELMRQRDAARKSLSEIDARIAERVAQIAVLEQAKTELDQRIGPLDQENRRLQAIEKKEKDEANAERLRKARLERLSVLMREKMAAETSAGLMRITAAEALEIELVDKLLFDAADPIVSKKGEEALLLIAGVLTSTAGLQLEVAAHTDEVPAAWESSAARAGATARVLTEKARMDPKNLEVRAFGSARPIASNKNASGRTKNRRIVLSVSIEEPSPKK